MSKDAGTPYAGLTPDVVLDALDSAGVRGDGRLLALNSYENRVYQVWLEPGRSDVAPAADAIVAKFYRPTRWTDAQILEEHAFTGELSESEIPVVAPLALTAPKASARATLASFGGFRFAVYPRQGGRAPELEDARVLERVGRFIGRIHAVGSVGSFEHRPVLSVERFGDTSRQYLLSTNFIPADLLPAWTSTIEHALEAVRRAFQRLGELRTLRLHGDCHAGNVLWTDAGPHFVDFDDSLTGPAVQDLWMLLSGDRGDAQVQLRALLRGYEDFCEFDDRELQIVEALRTLRLIHYSAWIARRWNDPAFPAAFPWFNTQRYWQDRVLELREQIAAMDEAPLVA
ncbi:MAG: serine/threonine protein kinase [Betaproteobacteria bacterium]